jgi:hypothetical protein
MKNIIFSLLVLMACGHEKELLNHEEASDVKRNLNMVESYHYSTEKNDSEAKNFIMAIDYLENTTGHKSHSERNWLIGYPSDSLFKVDMEVWEDWLSEHTEFGLRPKTHSIKKT